MKIIINVIKKLNKLFKLIKLNIIKVKLLKIEHLAILLEIKNTNAIKKNVGRAFNQ